MVEQICDNSSHIRFDIGRVKLSFSPSTPCWHGFEFNFLHVRELLLSPASISTHFGIGTTPRGASCTSADRSNAATFGAVFTRQRV
eukprot:3004994-Amphidinium_carterae.1